MKSTECFQKDKFMKSQTIGNNISYQARVDPTGTTIATTYNVGDVTQAQMLFHRQQSQNNLTKTMCPKDGPNVAMDFNNMNL